ncbi:MAG: DUF4247 domain-containing protein [Pseudonocardiaceae bacterium]|nr:DUF4247 domain-containing protein [Pseudonocardiaceae bacterium]
MRPKFFFVTAGVLALVGAIVAGVMLFGGTSVRDYVAQNYARSSTMDRGSEKAYTSPRSPSETSTEIVDAWTPVSQYPSAGGIFLRYSDDMVLIQPRSGGSVIRVDDVERAHRHYYGILGGVWGWSSGHGEAFRGRGPGAGK